MLGCNRCLKCKRSGFAIDSLCDQPQCFRDLILIPKTAILFFEYDQIACLIQARLSPRIVQEHQGNQTSNFAGRSRRHQRSDQQSKTNRLSAQISSQERFPSGRDIAFVEDQVDYRQHRIETCGQIVCVGHLIRNSRVANFSFRSHQPLGHRRRRHQKRARDFIGLQPAQGAQG